MIGSVGHDSIRVGSVGHHRNQSDRVCHHMTTAGIAWVIILPRGCADLLSH